MVWDRGWHRGGGSPDIYQRLERLAECSEAQAEVSRELNQLRIDATRLASALRGLLAAVDDMMHIDTAGRGQPQKARLTQAMRLAREALERLGQ